MCFSLLTALDRSSSTMIINKKGVSEYPCLVLIWGERSGRAPSIKLFINMLAEGFVGDLMEEISFYQS